MAFNPNELSNEEYFRLERQMAAEAPSREEQLARAVSLAMKPRRASGAKRPRRSKVRKDDTVSQIDPSMILEAINAIESPQIPQTAPESSQPLAEDLALRVSQALDAVKSPTQQYADNFSTIEQNETDANILPEDIDSNFQLPNYSEAAATLSSLPITGVVGGLLGKAISGTTGIGRMAYNTLRGNKQAQLPAGQDNPLGLPMGAIEAPSGQPNPLRLPMGAIESPASTETVLHPIIPHSGIALPRGTGAISMPNGPVSPPVRTQALEDLSRKFAQLPKGTGAIPMGANNPIPIYPKPIMRTQRPQTMYDDLRDLFRYIEDGLPNPTPTQQLQRVVQEKPSIVQKVAKPAKKRGRKSKKEKAIQELLDATL